MPPRLNSFISTNNYNLSSTASLSLHEYLRSAEPLSSSRSVLYSGTVIEEDIFSSSSDRRLLVVTITLVIIFTFVAQAVKEVFITEKKNSLTGREFPFMNFFLPNERF